MSVIRVKKDKNYVSILNNTVLTDPNLSFKAKGLWSYCMSRPDDWEFHVNQLANVSSDGKDAVYCAIKELVDAGYIKKIQSNVGGKFGKVDYEVSEIKIILPQRDLPHAEFPQTENPPLLSSDSSINIDKELNRVRSSQVFSDEKILRNMSLEINDVNSGIRSRERFLDEEIKDILCKYSHEEIHAAGRNCVARKKNKKNNLGPIQSEKAYFLSSLKGIKTGKYDIRTS